MGFWSGFEGLTGHKPGAFKGFNLKDILDKDMWERRERLNQGRRLEETGIPDTTMVYRGRGKPGAFGPVVGQQRQAQETPQVIPQAHQARHSRVVAGVYPPANVTTQGISWPNIQAQMLRDPLKGAGSMRIPTEELMGTQRQRVQQNPRQFRVSDMMIPTSDLTAEKKTVRTEYDDPNKSNTTVQTVVEKGKPSSIMNLVNQTYPQLNRTNQRAGYQTWPRHSGNAPGGFEGLLNRVVGWEGFNPASWAELARKRYEEDMRRRAAWQLKPSGSLTDRQMRY